MPNENPTVPMVVPPVQAPVNPKIIVESPSGTTQMPPITQGDQTVTPPQPKKKFPVGLILGLGVVLLLVVLFFLFRNIFTGTKKGSEADLTYWGLWEDEAMIEPLITEYETANPKVKINYIKQSQQDYRERLANALAKEGAPDIFRFHNTWVPMFKKDLDYIPASVMTATDFAQTFYPVASDDLTSGTGIVGIPLMYDGLTMFINEDIFTAAGKTPPTTWDDLRQVARELTVKDDKGTITQAGVALGRTENVDSWQDILALMMLQNGVNLNAPQGRLAEDALTFYTIFSQTDGVWDETLPPSTAFFAAGKLAMYFGPSWRAFEIKSQNPNLKFKAVPLPQLVKDNPSDPDVSFASYWVEGVWAKSPNKAAAWDFLKFLSSRESLQKMYQTASGVRPFGEPYSRVDMTELTAQDPYIGALTSQAPVARSWYLASRTWDGPTGINSLIGKYFEDAVNAMNGGEAASRALEPLATGVAQVLAQYGLSSK